MPCLVLFFARIGAGGCKTGNIRPASAQQHEQRTGQQQAERAEQCASWHRCVDIGVVLAGQRHEGACAIPQLPLPEISRAAFTYARKRLILVFAFVGGQVCNLAPHNQIQASSPKYASSLAAQQKVRADHLHGSVRRTRACH